MRGSPCGPDVAAERRYPPCRQRGTPGQAVMRKPLKASTTDTSGTWTPTDADQRQLAELHFAAEACRRQRPEGIPIKVLARDLGSPRSSLP